jgi:hypothetical protein
LENQASSNGLNDAGLLEGDQGAVLVDCLDGAGGKLQADVAAKLRNPDPLGLKVRADGALVDLGDVTTDTALFLGKARTVNLTPDADVGASDRTNFSHGKKWIGLRGGEKATLGPVRQGEIAQGWGGFVD